MSGSFDQDSFRLLGRLEQMAIDTREAAARLEESHERLEKRTDAIERGINSRHRENTEKMGLIQATVDRLAALISAVEKRLLTIEKPTVDTATRKMRRRAWVRRGWQIIVWVGGPVLVLIEPATKVAIEFWTRRYLDK